MDGNQSGPTQGPPKIDQNQSGPTQGLPKIALKSIRTYPRTPQNCIKINPNPPKDSPKLH